MALFSRKNKKESAAAGAAPAVSKGTYTGDVSHVLKHPRITEKASMHQMMGVYVFDVAMRATKTQITQAIEKYYKVRPRKVRIVPVPSKSTRNARTGKSGSTVAGKKAYVYLNIGETITIA